MCNSVGAGAPGALERERERERERESERGAALGGVCGKGVRGMSVLMCNSV
jgi:hypothetical protein